MKATASQRTIEELAHDADQFQSNLQNFSQFPLIGARELRRIWNARVRPFWRLHLGAYQGLTKRLVELGENYLAIETAAEGMEFFGDDPNLILSTALASARCGAIAQAQKILVEKASVLSDANEYMSLLGRTHKDLWKVSGESDSLQESYRCYHKAYQLERERAPLRATFPGANAASVALLLGNIADARALAQEVVAILSVSPSSDYWQNVTRAECELVLGEVEASRDDYSAAVEGSRQPHANLMTSRAQVRLLLPKIGLDSRAFDSCFPIPRVACFSGHRLDQPDRRAARFPVGSADLVKDRIREAVTKLNVGFGYSSAANGADILFLEVLQEVDREDGTSFGETYVNLPMSEAEFIEGSVRHPSSPEWIDRFHTVTSRATAVTRIATGLPAGGIVFEYANELSFGAASQKARELDTELIVLAVWDGRPGDGRGSTADMIRMASASGTRVEIISTLLEVGGPIPYEPPILRDGDSASLDEVILHGLAFGVRKDDEVTSIDLLAPVVRTQRCVATEVHGRWFHLFFDSAQLAAQAALQILSNLGPRVEHSLGLHSLPVVKRIHPVSGSITFSATLIEKASELAQLEPGGQIYATMGFSALWEKEGKSNLHCEFLGHRAVGVENRFEPIFRILRFS